MDAERLEVLVGFAAVCGASCPSSCRCVSHTHMHKITSFLCRSGNKGARDGEACQYSVRGVNANTLRLHRELLQRAAVGVAGTLDGRDGFAWRGGIFVQWVSAKRTGSGGLEKDGGWGVIQGGFLTLANCSHGQFFYRDNVLKSENCLNC